MIVRDLVGKQFAALSFGVVLATAGATAAQTNTTTQQTTTTTGGSAQTSTQTTGASSSSSSSQTRNVASGEKLKVQGVIVDRGTDTFTVLGNDNTQTTVRLTDDTRVTERKSNPFRRAKNYGTTNILRGLNVEVQGRGDATGQLVADRIRFTEGELRVARTVEARVNPVEGRVGSAENRIGQVEENAQRLSGQLDELAAVSNAARGGAKAAQDTADAAVAGVRATNDRISALDDYVAQQTETVTFKVGSATLSPEAKTQLDQVADKFFSQKNFLIEVTGYADKTGGEDANRRLSQRRADAVVRYLAEQHRIPLRRMITPFGYGESQPIADDTTREGRAQNRRVEVKVLVNRGLSQPAPEVNTPATNGTTSGTQQTSGQ